MKFTDIVGQDHILNHFQNAIMKDRVSHAYIISGEKGAGKKALARLFSQILFCESPKDGKPCGECQSCRQVISDNHPDVHFVLHEKPATISVDDVREQLNNDIMIKPYKGPYKVYIIDEAEKMNVEAQNAILKTIEEPPAYGVIILLSANPASFLTTILSRCVTLTVHPLSEGAITEYLTKNQMALEETARMAAQFSGGNLGKAIRFVRSEGFQEMIDNVVTVITNMTVLQTWELVAAVKEVEKYKLSVDDYLNIMAKWYRDILVYKATRDVNQLVFQGQMQEVIRTSEKCSFPDIEEIIKAIEKCRTRLHANVNFDLAVELMFMAINERMR